MRTLLFLKPFWYYNENSFVLLESVLDMHLLQNIEDRHLRHFAFPKRINAERRASIDNSLLDVDLKSYQSSLSNQMDFFEI